MTTAYTEVPRIYVASLADYTAFIAGWYAYIRNYHAITA